MRLPVRASPVGTVGVDHIGVRGSHVSSPSSYSLHLVNVHISCCRANTPTTPHTLSLAPEQCAAVAFICEPTLSARDHAQTQANVRMAWLQRHRQEAP